MTSNWQWWQRLQTIEEVKPVAAGPTTSRDKRPRASSSPPARVSKGLRPSSSRSMRSRQPQPTQQPKGREDEDNSSCTRTSTSVTVSMCTHMSAYASTSASATDSTPLVVQIRRPSGHSRGSPAHSGRPFTPPRTLLGTSNLRLLHSWTGPQIQAIA